MRTTTATVSAAPIEQRVGPVRLVGSGLAPPGQVLAAARGCFAAACRPGWCSPP